MLSLPWGHKFPQNLQVYVPVCCSQQIIPANPDGSKASKELSHNKLHEMRGNNHHPSDESLFLTRHILIQSPEIMRVMSWLKVKIAKYIVKTYLNIFTALNLQMKSIILPKQFQSNCKFSCDMFICMRYLKWTESVSWWISKLAHVAVGFLTLRTV